MREGECRLARSISPMGMECEVWGIVVVVVVVVVGAILDRITREPHGPAQGQGQGPQFPWPPEVLEESSCSARVGWCHSS